MGLTWPCPCPSHAHFQALRDVCAGTLRRLEQYGRVIEYHAVFVAMDMINIIQQFASGGTLAEL